MGHLHFCWLANRGQCGLTGECRGALGAKAPLLKMWVEEILLPSCSGVFNLRISLFVSELLAVVEGLPSSQLTSAGGDRSISSSSPFPEAVE